jgi:hypothetical protein
MPAFRPAPVVGQRSRFGNQWESGQKENCHADNGSGSSHGGLRSYQYTDFDKIAQ